jgi:uncharacterized protein YndB with AHSA1/START domain
MTTPSAQVSTEVETSLESAWKALTTPEVLGNAFFGSTVETTWELGSPILFRGEHGGVSFEDRGEILSFSPLKQLSFSHWTPLIGLEDKPLSCHVVTIDLVPGAKTRVRLTQEDGHPVDESTRRQLARNWAAILAGLKRTIERLYGRRRTD